MPNEPQKTGSPGARNAVYNEFQKLACEKMHEAYPAMTAQQLSKVSALMWQEVKLSGVDPKDYAFVDRAPIILRNCQEENIWEKLTRAAKGRKASRLEVYEWVHDHMGVDPASIDPKTIPSQGSPASLRFYKSNPKDFHNKYAAMKAGEDDKKTEMTLTQDGRDLRDIITAMREKLVGAFASAG